MHARQVTLLRADVCHTTYPVIGFDLTASEIREFLSIIDGVEKDGAIVSLSEVMKQLEAQPQYEKELFKLRAGYPNCFHTLGIRGFNVMLDRPAAQTNDSSVTLWGANGPVTGDGLDIPVSEEMLNRQFILDDNPATGFGVRGPWIWTGDNLRLTDREHRAERFLMKAAVARGQGANIAERVLNHRRMYYSRRRPPELDSLPWWDILSGEEN